MVFFFMESQIIGACLQNIRMPICKYCVTWLPAISVSTKHEKNSYNPYTFQSFWEQPLTDNINNPPRRQSKCKRSSSPQSTPQAHNATLQRSTIGTNNNTLPNHLSDFLAPSHEQAIAAFSQKKNAT